MNNLTNISLVGVGGQGILLTSEILARTALLCGFDVKKSEIHGMSQRGGSVSSQIRFGQTVASPIIPTGESDMLVAFEKIEAIRCHGLLRPDGRALIDLRDITPLTVSSGMQPGVEDRDACIRACYGTRATCVAATRIAESLGNVRCANLVLAGALATLLPFDVEAWHAAMRDRIKPAFLDLNIQAFDAGRDRLEQQRR